MVFKLKVIYLSKFPDGDTLDIRLIDLVPLDFELLLCNISSSFGVTLATDWSLGALDDYGDMLSISSDADLPLVFQAASRQADRRVLYFWHGARQGVKNTTAGSHVLHAGVYCDVCQQVIRGVRYKCVNCADYDLCQTCCTASAHCEHLMLRITSSEHNWRQMLLDSLRPEDHWPLTLPPRASTARSAAPTAVGDNNNNNSSNSSDTVQQQQQQTANDAKTARAAAEPTNILSASPRAVLSSVHAALAALGNGGGGYGGGAAAAAADCNGDALGDVGRSIVSVLQSLGLAAAAATAAATGAATAAADDTTPINTADSEPDTQQQQQQQQPPPPPLPEQQQQHDYQQQQPPVQQQQQDYQQQQQQQQQQPPEQQPQTYAELTSILKKHVSCPTPTRSACVPMSDICHDSAAPTSLSALTQSLHAATATSSTSTSITTTTTAARPTEGAPVNTSEIDSVNDWTMLGDTDVTASDTDSEQMLPPDLPQPAAPVPSVPIPLGWPARNIYHADPTVNAALIRLAEMGFDVANSLLVRMLEEENGDISVVLERMFQFA